MMNVGRKAPSCWHKQLSISVVLLMKLSGIVGVYVEICAQSLTRRLNEMTTIITCRPH